jgi:hypothetical protein
MCGLSCLSHVCTNKSEDKLPIIIRLLRKIQPVCTVSNVNKCIRENNVHLYDVIDIIRLDTLYLAVMSKMILLIRIIYRTRRGL